MKENPQVKQEWIQVCVIIGHRFFFSYNVYTDNAQNKRLDCPQLQCIVISWHLNRFVFIYIQTFFSAQAPIGAEEVEILRVVGQFLHC